MIDNNCLRIARHGSHLLAHTNTVIHTHRHSIHIVIPNHCPMASYAEAVVVNHCVLFSASRCESWCVLKSQWMWITMCYSQPLVVNHCELCWASGCESFWVMLSQWVWIMVSTTWFTTTGTAWLALIYNHWLSIAEHDSQPLAKHSSPWFTTIMLCKWLWIMLCYA
jgi:hypothetical protein